MHGKIPFIIQLNEVYVMLCIHEVSHQFSLTCPRQPNLAYIGHDRDGNPRGSEPDLKSRIYAIIIALGKALFNTRDKV